MKFHALANVCVSKCTLQPKSSTIPNITELTRKTLEETTQDIHTQDTRHTSIMVPSVHKYNNTESEIETGTETELKPKVKLETCFAGPTL